MRWEMVEVEKGTTWRGGRRDQVEGYSTEPVTDRVKWCSSQWRDQ
jgi:hypothetical protein